MRQVISAETLSTASTIGKLAVERLGIRDEKVKPPLQILLGTYDALYSLTRHHEASLFIAASEAGRLVHEKPLHRKFEYPSNGASIAKRIDFNLPLVAGYCSFLAQATQVESQNCSFEALTIAERTYVLHKTVQQVSLVGLEEEQAAFSKYLRQLFLYDPDAMENVDAGCFPKSILLVGPPGTGKTSLIKHCQVQAKELQNITGTPFRFESFDAANFSSYFGKSTRILKSKVQRVKDPSGVGLFVIEDVDMVLQSRDEGNAYHGVLQVQQYLMNELSGLEPYYGNTITILTTNRPDSLDAALLSRMKRTFEINPFTKIETHQAYFSEHLPHLSTQEQNRLSKYTCNLGLTGRALAAMLENAKEITTCTPTDDELRAKRRVNENYGAITFELIENLIAGRTVAQHKRA